MPKKKRNNNQKQKTTTKITYYYTKSSIGEGVKKGPQDHNNFNAI